MKTVGSTLRRFVLSEGAQSVVELALTLPLLVGVLLAGADLARAYAVQLAVTNGARAGAEGTALDVTPTNSEATAWAQQEMARTPGMIATNAVVTTTFAQVNGTTPCTGAANTSIAGTSTYLTPCYVTVRVRYTFNTITPWPLIPNTFNFDRSTVYRRYQ